jgi:hypothetical protein
MAAITAAYKTAESITKYGYPKKLGTPKTWNLFSLARFQEELRISLLAAKKDILQK